MSLPAPDAEPDLLDEDTRLPFVWLAAEVMRKLPLD